MNIEIRDFIVEICPVCGAPATISTTVRDEDEENRWHVYCDNEYYHGKPAEIWEDDLLTALENWNEYCMRERRK